MLKIGKGLHKKKKSKKNKHREDELFTEEELEKYRKENLQKATDELDSNSGEKKVVSEELEKFKALTAGVDDILRKSQGDLDRIKKDSFFQKKPTPSELKLQAEEEKKFKNSENQWVEFEDKNNLDGESVVLKKEEQEQEEDSESDYEFDNNNDIFDTTYVDALEKGEVKLVFISEDDDIIKEGESDPFDTSSAEEVLKKVQEEEEKKKRQISLGLAVQVLTGRAERDKSILEESGASDVLNVEGVSSKPKIRTRKTQDFALIGSFDDESVSQFSSQEQQVFEAPKILLDEDIDANCDLPEDCFIPNICVGKQETNFESNNKSEGIPCQKLNEDLSEFDVLNQNITSEVVKAEEVDDQFDEFTALAASSVANQRLDEELQIYENLEDDPFDTSTVNNVLNNSVDPFGAIDTKIPSPQIFKLPLTDSKWSAFDSTETEEAVEVDPFDTSFIEKIQPGKCELKLVEDEILGNKIESTYKSHIHQEARILSRNNSDSDFHPRIFKEVTKFDQQSPLSKTNIQINNSRISDKKFESEGEFVENISGIDYQDEFSPDFKTLYLPRI